MSHRNFDNVDFPALTTELRSAGLNTVANIVEQYTVEHYALTKIQTLIDRNLITKHTIGDIVNEVLGNNND